MDHFAFCSYPFIFITCFRNACKRIRPDSHLAYVSSEEKHKILRDLAIASYNQLDNQNPINYHIGLSYNENLGMYTWEGGVPVS